MGQAVLPRAATKYEVRAVSAAEAEEAVVDLWRERPSGTSRPLFEWGYRKSPLGPTRCFLLRAIPAGGAPAVVGMVGIFERRVVAFGETLSAGLLGDFFVGKAHRTFFPALTLQRAVLASTRKDFDLVYGFPNDAAAPLMKKLGFRPLARMERHVLVVRHAPYLRARVPTKVLARAAAVPIDAYRRFVHPGTSWRARRGLAFAPLERVDERIDRLFQRRAFAEVAMGRRDASLLRWRFLERPNEATRVYGLSSRSTGELRAYVVLHLAKDIAHVRDLLGADVGAMSEALRLAAGVARRHGCTALSFVCAAPPELESELYALGFRVRPPVQTLIGYPGDRLTNPRVLTALERWYATAADEDQ